MLSGVTMDNHNFWFWLIEGARDFVIAIAQRLPLYVPVGLPVLIYNALLGALTPILFYVGSFFNLCWFMAALALFAASETARASVAAYRQLVKLLPLP